MLVVPLFCLLKSRRGRSNAHGEIPIATVNLRASIASHPDWQNRLEFQIGVTNYIREIVEGWYLGHLGAEFVRHDAGDKVFPGAFREARISDDYVTFVGERSEQVRIAAMAPDSTGTTITLVRFSKHAGQ